MEAVVEVTYGGVKKFEERYFHRYTILVNLLNPTDRFIHAYEHVGMLQGESFDTRLLPHKVRDFQEENRAETYTSYVANLQIGALLLKIEDQNKDLVKRVRVKDIETNPLMLAKHEQTETKSFSGGKVSIAYEDAIISAPVPPIQPVGKSRYDLSLDNLTADQEVDFVMELLSIEPRFLQTQNRRVSSAEYSAFFGSSYTGDMPIDIGSLAERLRETAFAMEHGIPFIYSWTNVVPLGIVRGEGSEIVEYNQLVKEFHTVCEEDRMDDMSGIRISPPEIINKKVRILNAMADVAGRTSIFDEIREKID